MATVAQRTPEQRRTDRILALAGAFSPNTPVTKADLFAKRGKLMDDLLDTLIQPGAHAVIYGERGVGKTSFVSVMSEVYQRVLMTARTNCTSEDSFSDIWHNVFETMTLGSESRLVGFGDNLKKSITTARGLLPERVTPNDVRKALSLLSNGGRVVVILIDEFDRVSSATTKRLFADTIKMLSDYGLNASIVLVGVADSVTQLIAEHESINRNLVQVLMPRMVPAELAEIVDKGLAQVDMTITREAKNRIVSISRGLPHYTHTLALYAARNASNNDRDNVASADVDSAIKNAIQKAQEYVQAMYQDAVKSAQKANYEQVLLACALAPVSDRGSFAAADVRDPMSKIMGKRYEIPNFINNLNLLASEGRGSVLEKIGTPRAYRFRFRDPLLQPYVVMRGIDKGLIKSSDV